MKLVILESPFKEVTAELKARNIAYLKEAMSHSLHLGESPIASLLTWAMSEILDDNNPDERKLGMEAGFAWYKVAEACVVYQDFGISRGMIAGIKKAADKKLPIFYRLIHEQV